MTVDSYCQTQHLMAPAMSTEYPIIQEDVHRRLNQEQQRALDLASDEERETARTMVSRLHVEIGHSDARGIIKSLRRKHTRRPIIATAQKFSCSACEESQRRRLRSVAARVLHELGICLQSDQFEWRHPVLNLHVLGTIMVDAGRRAASVTIQRVMDTEHGLDNMTGELMLNTVLNHCIKYYGKSNIIRTDPEGAFSRSGFSTWSCCQECMGKHWIPSNKQQHVWLEELLTVSQFKKSSMSARLFTKTCIEILDSLRGRCCCERHRQTSRFVRIILLLSTVLQLWTKLQSSVSV